MIECHMVHRGITFDPIVEPSTTAPFHDLVYRPINVQPWTWPAEVIERIKALESRIAQLEAQLAAKDK